MGGQPTRSLVRPVSAAPTASFGPPRPVPETIYLPPVAPFGRSPALQTQRHPIAPSQTPRVAQFGTSLRPPVTRHAEEVEEEGEEEEGEEEDGETEDGHR